MKSFALTELAGVIGGVLDGCTGTERSALSVTASTVSISSDSLFVAIRGFTADGHSFVGEAFERGAVAAVVEDSAVLSGRPGIVVSNTRAALSRLASLFHGDPSLRLKVVGITGTNGKTTTNWIVYHALNAIGGGCQRIGTLGSECMGRDARAGNLTSPDPISIHGLMSEALQRGAHNCVLETSSHALDQLRVEDLSFDVGVFTNLTRDHLDYHQTFEHYFSAKRHLFELLSSSSKKTKAAVINSDDPYGRSLIAELPQLGLHDWSFGNTENAAIRMMGISEAADEMTVRVFDSHAGSDVIIRAPFIGRHNAENLLSAYAACRALGHSVESVVGALAGVPQVPGRLERVDGNGPRVFVDYAHTPDALMRALQAVRPTAQGDVWVVFGCGGDRDRGKRPEMASIASEHAEQVVITSDNPRTESPESIINDILIGATSPRIVEVDRRLAIKKTIAAARPQDTIVIAGKGHEDYQIIGTEKRHFSDQAVAREYLARCK